MAIPGGSTIQAGRGTNEFSKGLDQIAARLEHLADQEAPRVIEWTLRSAASQVIKEIRRPESRGGWPVDTGLSWQRWGFKKARGNRGIVSFEIYNDAPSKRGRRKGESYAPWVYAKGDGARRKPIAPGIVSGAIASVRETIVDNYRDRLGRYLSRRR